MCVSTQHADSCSRVILMIGDPAVQPNDILEQKVKQNRGVEMAILLMLSNRYSGIDIRQKEFNIVTEGPRSWPWPSNLINVD